jgi:copper homeostasis protein CutC
VSPRVLIEAAVETPEDAAFAEGGGADRLELCSALDLGGLTPTLGTFFEISAARQLPVFVMIRPRGGDFVYTASEFRVMCRDLETLLTYRPAGFVFGLLKPDGQVDWDRCGELIQRAGGLPCVFHRAFDRTPDLPEALEELITLGFRRVLTSGREATAIAGAKTIATLVAQAAGRIEVLPCGQIRAKDVAEVVRVTKCNQVHGSFALPLPVEEGRGYRGYPARLRTNSDEIRAVQEALANRDATPQ